MREKKPWKKPIEEEESILKGVSEKNQVKHEEARKSTIKDDELFKVNVSKDGLKNKREKLKKDRFKEKERANKSDYEEVMVKRLVEKVQRKKELGLDKL